MCNHFLREDNITYQILTSSSKYGKTQPPLNKSLSWKLIEYYHCLLNNSLTQIFQTTPSPEHQDPFLTIQLTQSIRTILFFKSLSPIF